jgi:type IV pilus assembly protein PilO
LTSSWPQPSSNWPKQRKRSGVERLAHQDENEETQYRTVMRALPEKEEIPSLLAGVSQAGKDAGLDFLLFKPRPESVKGFYAEIPVDINVAGSYHQVAVFF